MNHGSACDDEGDAILDHAGEGAADAACVCGRDDAENRKECKALHDASLVKFCGLPARFNWA